MTSRHVTIDKPSMHFPNRIGIEIHTDATNLTRSSSLSMQLYLDGKGVWHQGNDVGGEIDVAVIELDRSALPQSVRAAVLHAGASAALAPGGGGRHARC